MSKRIRMGVIGCGGNARGHLRNLTGHPEVTIVALTDPAKWALEATRRTLPGLAEAPSFADHRRMLRQVDMDAVLISTPHTLHYRQITDSINAGCHVLCEKPLTTSTAETRKVIAHAKRKRKAVVVGFQRRFEAMRQFMRSFVRDESFGRPMSVQAFCSQGWLNAQRGQWRQDPGLSGGGQLNDTGAHIVDMILWTMPSKVVEVVALIDSRKTKVDIDSAVSFRFADGALGSLTIVGSGPRNVFWEDMTITGSNDRALFLRKGELTATTGSEVIEYKSFGRDGNKDSHFVDVVRRRAKNASPPRDFLAVIAFTEACWTSAAGGGKPVKVTY